ncbi:MAG: arginine repressor [Actinomycetota bacterium]
MRSSRKRDLTRILREGTASSQADIVAELRGAGHEVTQATISRDLQELGALKVRVNGHFLYRLPDEVPRGHGDLMARNLVETLGEFALDIRVAATLLVVSTAPGHAAAVARAIDLAPEPDAVGSVAGDDTIFIATPSAAAAKRLAARWSERESQFRFRRRRPRAESQEGDAGA